jgi:cell division protein FtsZ
LLQISIVSSTTAPNITAGKDLQLAEAYEISDIVKEATGKTAEEVMFGAVVDDTMENTIRLTLVATDFQDFEREKVEKEVETKKADINKAIKATQEAQPFGEVDELDIPAFYRRKK